MQSGTPSNGFVRGRELEHTGSESRSSLSLMILSRKKVENSQAAEIRLAEELIVFASTLFVILYSSLVEDAEEILQL